MKIGLALGSGAARGWSHIGVIRALEEIGVVPDIVCGTSIGALVGASYVSGRIDQLEEWVLALSKLQTAKYFEINASLNGFVNKERLHRFLSDYVADDAELVEEMDKSFAAVATHLESGREIWLTDGPLVEAVWSSISLPGLFPAIKNDNRWLVDGGLVNPVPVSVCRALGADMVIAVNLNGNVVGKHFKNKPARPPRKETGVVAKIADLVADYTNFDFDFQSANNKDQPPGLFDAIAGSINITQDRITRSRLAGDPPDVHLVPQLSGIGLLEFYRARQCIEEGYESVKRMQSDIEFKLKS